MLLEGITVVELFPNLALAYATRLLSDLGATVIMLEPSSGSDIRKMEPKFSDDDESVFHAYLNQGKQSVVVDLADTDVIVEILKSADIFIEPLGQTIMQQYQLGYEQLKDQLPSLVYASQSPYGNFGPHQDRHSSEIVDYATGGFLYYCGDPEREPLSVNGYQSSWHAGMHVATAALFAHIYSIRTGIGQHVDVSNQETLLSAHVWLISSWLEEGEVFTRKGSGLIKCKDGYILWGLRTLDVFLLMERPELMDDPKYHTDTGWRDAQPEVEKMLADYCINKGMQEIFEFGQQLRLKICPVNTPQDLLDSEQFAARDWWKNIEMSTGNQIQIPTPPWKMNGEQLKSLLPAPSLNAHAEIINKKISLKQRWPKLNTNKPLAGIRVLEITTAWAGPLVGRHLADMGAEVFLIEPPRVQPTRGHHFPGGSDQIWPHFYNRGSAFNQLNRNKRGMMLDIRHPDGQAQILEMVKNVDVIIENNSVHVMNDYGMGFAVLSKINPKLVMCSISGFGATGPHAHYVALGSNIEASGGLVSQTGYYKDDHFGSGTYVADPIAGTLGSLTIMSALLDAVASGKGRHIDISLQESLTTFMIDNILRYQINGVANPPRGNKSLTMSPNGVYQCAGNDSWLALSIADDIQWQTLAGIIGQPTLATTYKTFAERKANEIVIDEAITYWAKALDHNQATKILQAAGIPSGPVLANWEIAADPHLYYRNFWMEGVHPEVGYQRWEGAPWKFSETPATMEKSAPLFNQHADEILREFAGRSDEEIAKLREDGITLDRPSDIKLFVP